jgi:hypothetical protein
MYGAAAFMAALVVYAVAPGSQLAFVPFGVFGVVWAISIYRISSPKE